MPMHDWTRVRAGIYHDFHNAWITELRTALNEGLLPADYYALGEQRSGDIGPDVLTLHVEDDESSAGGGETGGMIALAEAPPQVQLAQEAEDVAYYLARQRTIVIRHASGDRIVALIEIVSPANKHNEQTVEAFVDKVVAALRDRIHVMVLDVLPPTRWDPEGMHGAIWRQLMAGEYTPADEAPLTLASYCVRQPLTAYVEPTSVGRVLADMPLFLTPEHYIPAPLEAAYQEAWRGFPKRWRNVLED